MKKCKTYRQWKTSYVNKEIIKDVMYIHGNNEKHFVRERYEIMMEFTCKRKAFLPYASFYETWDVP